MLMIYFPAAQPFNERVQEAYDTYLFLYNIFIKPKYNIHINIKHR